MMFLINNGWFELYNLKMRRGGPGKSKQFNAKAYERPGLTEEEVL